MKKVVIPFKGMMIYANYYRGYPATSTDPMEYDELEITDITYESVSVYKIMSDTLLDLDVWEKFSDSVFEEYKK